VREERVQKAVAPGLDRKGDGPVLAGHLQLFEQSCSASVGKMGAILAPISP
jgi:hypothetical protein